jgi:glutathione synthase/RimK-type ligase-like ATP-grasp enzyme
MTKRAVGSKWLKYNLLYEHPDLTPHLPVTQIFSKKSLRTMLQRYARVYVKPDHGARGIGVMRVSVLQGKYTLRYEFETREFREFEQLYEALRKRIKQRYLVQQGVDVLRRDGRPFDFRIMVQRRHRGDKWKCTGIAGRVAAKGKIVSNGSQGGTIYSARALLVPFVATKRYTQLLAEMYRVTIAAAETLSKQYPHLLELGIDLALSRGNYHPWILEVNTLPEVCPFTKLPDKAMLHRILAYGKYTGRRYKLHCTKAKAGSMRGSMRTKRESV